MVGESKVKVLITGGAGFIGSHIAERLQNSGSVIVYDDLSSGKPENLQGMDVELIEGDVCDRGALKEACEGVGTVFHLAARVDVAESMEHPRETVRVNTEGTLNLMEACSKQGVRTVVFSSSAAIYGDSPTLPKREGMIPEPKSPYAVSKLDGEYYLRLYGEQYGMKTVSLRYFNVYGPRQNPTSDYAAVIPAFLQRAVRNEDITIYGDGSQTRDFIYVEDVVGANLLAAGLDSAAAAAEASEAKPSRQHGVYNVASASSVSVNDLAETIREITGSRSRIVHTAPRAGDVKHSLADTSRIWQDLGFSVTVGLEEGLRRTAQWFGSALALPSNPG
jgi:UDP-glucose 4-epimerase